MSTWDKKHPDSDVSVRLDVPDIQNRLDLIEERIEFIMHSVMIPKVVENKVVGPGVPPSKTVLIPLSVMWNALENIKQRIRAEKEALLTQQDTNNG